MQLLATFYADLKPQFHRRETNRIGLYKIWHLLLTTEILTLDSTLIQLEEKRQHSCQKGLDTRIKARH